MSSSDSDSDSDPILASYDVYVKPKLSDGRSLFILQFPNRPSTLAYSSATSALPSELRIKQKAGLVELDVPIDVWHNYDRTKGGRWGDALRRTAAGVSHGLPGGFGIGTSNIRSSGRGAAASAHDDDAGAHEVGGNFASAVTAQRVLTKQTLGGMAVPKEQASPTYMIGAFAGRQLHLTPVDEIVQMRPQFHHLDSLAELERQARPRADAAAAPRAAEPRAIHMTVKTLGDEEETTDTMAERIRAAQDEPWRRLVYRDEDSNEAWAVFEDDLFVRGAEAEAEASALPRLVSALGDDEYLDAISAPRDVARLSRSKGERRRGSEAMSTER
jgi:DNA-directed RNA polymerase-3 subunit RPC5